MSQYKKSRNIHSFLFLSLNLAFEMFLTSFVRFNPVTTALTCPLRWPPAWTQRQRRTCPAPDHSSYRLCLWTANLGGQEKDEMTDRVNCYTTHTHTHLFCERLLNAESERFFWFYQRDVWAERCNWNIRGVKEDSPQFFLCTQDACKNFCLAERCRVCYFLLHNKVSLKPGSRTKASVGNDSLITVMTQVVQHIYTRWNYL